MPNSASNLKSAGNTAGGSRLWGKLSNWWSDSGHAADGKTGIDENSPLENVSDDSVWSPLRLQLLQDLFGDGQTTPAVEKIAPMVFRQLHLDKDCRVVELGAGLGGFGALLHRDTETRLDAFVDEVELVDRAVAWLETAAPDIKIDRRALNDTGPKRGFADAVISKEGLTGVRNKNALFDHAFNLLKPTGKLIFTDLFLTGDDPECPEVAVWSAMEHRAMFLMNPGRFRDKLYDIGFDMPVMEDITEAYMTGIRKAFARAPEILANAGDLAARLQPLLVREAEYWSRRTTLLESGEAKVWMVTARVYQGGDVI